MSIPYTFEDWIKTSNLCTEYWATEQHRTRPMLVNREFPEALPHRFDRNYTFLNSLIQMQKLRPYQQLT